MAFEVIAICDQCGLREDVRQPEMAVYGAVTTIDRWYRFDGQDLCSPRCVSEYALAMPSAGHGGPGEEGPE